MLSKRSQKLKNQSKPTLRQSKLPKDVIFDDDSDSSDDDDEATLGSFRNSLEKKLLVQHERDDVFKDDDVNEDEDDSEDEDTDESTTEAEEKKAGDSVSLVNKAINAKIEDFKASLDSLKRKNEDDVGQSDNDPDENNGGSGESDNDYDDEEEDSESSDNMEEESEEETKLAPHQAKKRKLAKMEASKKKVQRFSDGDNNKDGTIQSDEEETRVSLNLGNLSSVKI